MSSELGVSDEKIVALESYATSPLYGEGERVALEYADAITLSEKDVDDELFARAVLLRRRRRGRAYGGHRLGELFQQVQPGPARALPGALETKNEG